MIQRKSNDVFAEIDKCSLLWKAAGLFTSVYSLGEFKTSKNWFIWSFFALMPLLVFNIYLVLFAWKTDPKSLYGSLGTAQVLLVMLCLFIMWLVNVVKLDSLNKGLRKIQVVDHYLFSIGEKIPASKPSKILISIIMIIILTFLLRLPTIKTHFRYFTAFTMYYCYFLMFIVCLLLDRMFAILFLRYQVLTDVLRKGLALQGKKVAILSEKMVFCYECLSSSGERLNHFFSFQILSILTAIFIISFSEVYAVIQLFYDGEPLSDKKITFISKVVWSSITFLTIWQFGYRFSTISDKAKEFNSLLYRLMIEDGTNIVLHNEKLRLHFTLKREIVFTACGLFKLDCTLVHSMIASATTYLVILIQFGQLTPNEAHSGAPTASAFYDTTTPTIFSTGISNFITTRI